MKETLQIIMKPTLIFLGGFLTLFFVAAIAFSDGRRGVCDKAVESAMKGKHAYKLFEVIRDSDEGPVERESISSFKYIYRYYTNKGGPDLHVGVLECLYVDDGSPNPVSLHGKEEIDWIY